MRSADSGVGWDETFVHTEKGALSENCATAIKDSYSYVTLADFATADECRALQDSALRIAEDGHDQPHVLAASEVHVNCTRYSVQSLLDVPAQAAHTRILTRLLNFLEHDPELYKVFARAQLADPNANTTTWYTEPDDQGNECPEPKVNIYGQDGFFKEHTDGMQLTILVVLNEGYTGGGTAFFAEAPYQMWMDRSEQADRVSIPRAGTALIWGGSLWHMALPVRTGMRAVYVGSFDLIETNKSSKEEIK